MAPHLRPSPTPFEVETLSNRAGGLRPISTPMRLLAIATAGILAAVGTVVLVADGSDDVSAAGVVAAEVAGVHVLQQVQSNTIPASQVTQINAALDVPGVTAFGIRVPWSLVDTNFAVLDQAQNIAEAHGDELTVRFMAGVHTPTRVKTACASQMIGSGSTAYPAPFTTSGALNTCFITEYRTFVERLAVWARANGVHLLHLSHYARDWAEFYYGPEIQSRAGTGSATAMVNATNALADVGIAVSGTDLAAELPMSGHGPLMRPPAPGIAERVTQHVVAVIGQQSDRFFIQGNGWDTDGIWGAPSAATEANFDWVLTYGALLGVQMIQPQQYNWTAVFNVAEAKRATYGEVYLPSFSGIGSAQLKAEIGLFAPWLPAVTPPPTTTSQLPTSTSSSTTSTSTLPPTTTTLPCPS